MTDEGFLKHAEENKDTIQWLLEKQSELRAELMTFYKKDLKEILSTLSAAGDSDNPHESPACRFFLEQWRRSYDMVSPRIVPDGGAARTARAGVTGTPDADD